MPRLVLIFAMLLTVSCLSSRTISAQELFPKAIPGPGGSAPPEGPPPEQVAPAPALPSPAAAALEIPDTDTFGGGRGGRGGFGSEFSDPLGRIGGTGILANYRITWLPSEAVTGTANHFQSVREEWSVAFPLWRDVTDRIGFSVHLSNTLLDTDATVPKEGGPFPGSLWDIGFGLNWQHRFENNWIGGLGVMLGSASDQPFSGIDEIRVGLNGFLRIPWNEHAYWNFSLAYSPFGELGFPIPGIAYVWQPSEYFRMSIGLPFSIMWRPTDDLTIDASYMLLTNVRARVSYRLNPRLNLYGEYVQSTEGYYLEDRTVASDRLLFRDGRLEGGLQCRIGGRAMLEIFGGFVFDRSISEGREVGGLGADAIFVNPGGIFGGRLQIRW
jgi:hypothetical protein